MRARNLNLKWIAAVALALGTPAAPLLWGTRANAADHTEAPGTRGAENASADIGDVYAWHNATAGKLIAVITFAGKKEPAADQKGTYDSNVLYELHIDNDGDNEPDIDVDIRFGQNDAGEWGVKVENLPGAAVPVVGPVETNIDAGGDNWVFAGLKEEPFFFDLDGFVATLDSGTLMFNPMNDFFAGLNCTAVVLRMDLAAAIGAGSSLQVWATTVRKAGG